MILFKAEAILASSTSTFGKSLPSIDREQSVGFCRTEASICIVFAVQPKNSVVFPMAEKNSLLTAFFQTSAS